MDAVDLLIRDWNAMTGGWLPSVAFVVGLALAIGVTYWIYRNFKMLTQSIDTLDHSSKRKHEDLFEEVEEEIEKPKRHYELGDDGELMEVIEPDTYSTVSGQE